MILRVQIGSGEGSDWAEGVQFGFVRFARFLVTSKSSNCDWVWTVAQSEPYLNPFQTQSEHEPPNRKLNPI